VAAGGGLLRRPRPHPGPGAVAKAADLRRFLSRHAKSNAIDAETLARLPLVDPGGLQPLELADGPQASLNRRVRTCQWLTEQATAHKVRIHDLARQLFPTLNSTSAADMCNLAPGMPSRATFPTPILDPTSGTVNPLAPTPA
jgi:hypothetical protein